MCYVTLHGILHGGNSSPGTRGVSGILSRKWQRKLPRNSAVATLTGTWRRHRLDKEFRGGRCHVRSSVNLIVDRCLMAENRSVIAFVIREIRTPWSDIRDMTMACTLPVLQSLLQGKNLVEERSSRMFFRFVFFVASSVRGDFFSYFKSLLS